MEVGTKDECWYRLQLRLCLQVAWSTGEAEPGGTLELSTKIREDFTIMEEDSNCLNSVLCKVLVGANNEG